MAENAFYLGTLWSSFSTNKDRLTLGTFGNKLQLSVWLTGERKPAVSMSLGPAATRGLRQILKVVMESKEPIKRAYYKPEYIRETKTFETVAQFLIIKDEKGAVSVEVSGKAVRPSVSFPVKAPTNFNMGADGLSLADKCTLELEGLIDILDNAAVIRAISTYNNPPTAFGGKGGGNSRGGGSSGGDRRQDDDEAPAF